MITEAFCRDLINYWQSEHVKCEKVSLPIGLDATDLGIVWKIVGMPFQDWWLFRFELAAAGAVAEKKVQFGTAGDNWTLLYQPQDGICAFKDAGGISHIANSSFHRFMECLVEFDRGCKRIQRECGGDSGDDWDQGDAIVGEMEKKMRMIDAVAFDDPGALWPLMLLEING